MTNIPKYIYLNVGTDEDLTDVNFDSLSELTWSVERINDSDIKYQLKQ